MLKEFKQFIMRGNVLDLAIGIVIGAAFGKIVSSFVSDILMPPIGLILGKVDFSNLFVDLSGSGYASLAAARTAGAPVFAYGLFLNSVLDFLIIALAVFIVVKAVNRFQRKEEAAQAAAAEPSASEKLLTEIRDLLQGMPEKNLSLAQAKPLDPSQLLPS